MIILVQKSCLHNDCKWNQSRTKIPYYAAIFSQSPSTPPGCDVGYGEREFQRQLSASCLLLCFFWSCVSKFNGTLYSHCPCRTSQPCSILTKWQPPIWLGYCKAGVLHAAPTPPTVVAQAWFYIKSIVVLLLINTTTLQLQCFLLL